MSTLPSGKNELLDENQQKSNDKCKAANYKVDKCQDDKYKGGLCKNSALEQQLAFAHHRRSFKLPSAMPKPSKRIRRAQSHCVYRQHPITRAGIALFKVGVLNFFKHCADCL
jgi:hypothetical protein